MSNSVQIQLLEQSPHEYELIEHPYPIKTALQGAEYFKIEVGQTAPTLIIKADNKFHALIFSGSRKQLDLQEVASVLGCDKVKLASKTEVWEITGFPVGNIPMVGLSLPCVFDKKLFTYPFVFGGTGDPNITLKISPSALQQLNNVVAYID
ncbi:MAG TPA: YbaK/EbsC family protein [Negativicutes bacterium]|nr:YbaK/EbsC family protein [Negativicutes bacterium]